jgi:hypothetical protein
MHAVEAQRARELGNKKKKKARQREREREREREEEEEQCKNENPFAKSPRGAFCT